jgi:hypothetical protein
MYPQYSAQQATLAQDDIDGICFLYPACMASECASTVDMSTDPSPGGDDPVLDGRDGPSCILDTDCPSGLACHDRICSAPLARLGDPCDDRGCHGSTCSVDNVCIPLCEPAPDCSPLSSSCTYTAECPEPRSAFGAACDDASDCDGGECLEENGRGVCTRRCDAHRLACPLGWECKAVAAKDVCVPPEKGSEGCSIGSRPSSDSYAPSGLLIVLAVGAVGRRRRTR